MSKVRVAQLLMLNAPRKIFGQSCRTRVAEERVLCATTKEEALQAWLCARVTRASPRAGGSLRTENP